MNWEKHFAARAGLLRRNTVREFLKRAGEPGIISFAGGLPASALLPVREIQIATERALERFGSKALQYGPSEGIPELRAWVARRFEKFGATADNVLITSGSQQALDLMGRVLLENGDRVVVQNPTYLAALSAWAPFGVRFQTFDRWDGEPIGLAYCIPNFSNPSGETLGGNERRDLVERCAGIPLLEDDAYGDLRFEGESIPSLLEIGGNLECAVVQAGTLSKVLAPGLRLGWIIGAKELIAKLVQARQGADLHTSTFTQYVAFQAIEDGVLDELLPGLRAAYRHKRDVMLECLERAMPPGSRWSRPEGGLFIMLHLPEGMDGRTFSARALERGVLAVPGEEFHIEGGLNTVRLNFSNATLEQIREGVGRLGACIESADPSRCVVH